MSTLLKVAALPLVAAVAVALAIGVLLRRRPGAADALASTPDPASS